MEILSSHNDSPEARTEKVIEAYRYLCLRIDEISNDLEILNGRLDNLPAQFITGAAKIPTRDDIKRLEKLFGALCVSHDVYCAEFIIMNERVVRMLNAYLCHTDKSFQ